MTAASTPSPYVISASGNYGAYAAWHAMDLVLNLAYSWIVASTTTSWRKLDNGS